METITERIAAAFGRVRAEKPLLHQITNFVVMNDTANVTLHIGALPVMAHAIEEVTDMVQIANALVLNIGTLSPPWIDAMLVAGRQANAAGVPIVLDPVGSGATPYRTQTSLRLLDELQIAVVRGNAGEISALSGLNSVVRGVESVASDDPVVIAQKLARERGLVVAVSGKRDIIADGQRVLAVENGHEWLTTLTGTGCMATAVTGAFIAVERDYLLAAAAAMTTYGVAAELAARQAQGPASFKVAFFDQLYHLRPEQVATQARVVDLTEHSSEAA